ncbi:MAG: hypothetical protein IT371_30815 [Deltaproteobacteria bacterium]|nr:hypothetical protein [Deltaproteobacteria bacterium]
MDPHQQRVVYEKADLDGKLGRLKEFINNSHQYAALDAAEQGRLRRQCAIMADYSAVLGERIAAFSQVL